MLDYYSVSAGKQTNTAFTLWEYQAKHDAGDTNGLGARNTGLQPVHVLEYFKTLVLVLTVEGTHVCVC